MTKYTAEDDRIIRSNYLTMTLNELGAICGNRKAANIFYRVKKLGLSGKRKLISAGKYSRTPTWSSWCNMKTRCYNKRCVSYPRYGGRGIKVCSRWLKSYKHFLEDMGVRKPSQSLDRINPDGNYEPSNCRWIEQNLQSRTTRRFINCPACVDCGSSRGNRVGRCHKCNEYFRRHGHARPPVENILAWRKIPRKCENCNRMSSEWVLGICERCYRAKWAREQRKRIKNEVQHR